MGGGGKETQDVRSPVEPYGESFNFGPASTSGASSRGPNSPEPLTLNSPTTPHCESNSDVLASSVLLRRRPGFWDISASKSKGPKIEFAVSLCPPIPHSPCLMANSRPHLYGPEGVWAPSDNCFRNVHPCQALWASRKSRVIWTVSDDCPFLAADMPSNSAHKCNNERDSRTSLPVGIITVVTKCLNTG